MRRRLMAKILYVILALNIVFACIYGYVFISILSNNFRLYYVATSSMEPWIPQYSLVLIRRTKIIDYSLGDVIIYYYQVAHGAPELFHRIVGFDKNYVIVKGDAVNSSERIVSSSVTGVFVFGVPYLGFIPAMLYKYGLTFGFIVLAIVTLIVFFPYSSKRE